MAVGKDISGTEGRRLADFRRHVLRVMAEDARETIIKRSNKQLIPNVTTGPTKANVYIEKGGDDPDGEKARKIERQTQAFATAYRNLRNPAYVGALIKRSSKS